MPHRGEISKTKRKSRSRRKRQSEPRGSSSRAVGSSSSARPSSRRSTEPTTQQPTTGTQRMDKRTESEEKKAYDNFFTYLPLNAWLYDPRRDPLPSFPRTREEFAELIREPTESDLESLGEDIAAGRIRVKIRED